MFSVVVVMTLLFRGGPVKRKTKFELEEKPIFYTPQEAEAAFWVRVWDYDLGDLGSYVTLGLLRSLN